MTERPQFTEDELRNMGYVFVNNRNGTPTAIKQPKGVMPSAASANWKSGPEYLSVDGGVTHPPKSTSKYRNVRVTVHGQKFDSQREANYFLALKAREAAGEIHALRCQVPFELECPIKANGEGIAIGYAVVARYVADFTYRDRKDVLHVIDVKSPPVRKNKTYRLKAKWMNLQYGLVIEEL